MNEPKATAYVISNGSQVMETKRGPADIIVFDLEYVTKAEPNTELKMVDEDGELRIYGRLEAENDLFLVSRSFVARVKPHPTMMMGWGRESIKEELCRRVDQIFDMAEARKENGK